MMWKPREKFQLWPADVKVVRSVKKIRELYEDGFAGAHPRYAPDAAERFRAEMPHPDGEQLATAVGLAGGGEGQLCIPYLFTLLYYPSTWPGAAQTRGDCVSHSQKNSLVITMGSDIHAGVPDAETGVVEGAPEVAAEGIRQGLLSSESIYWYRGYNGDGWYCPAAASVALKTSGMMLRQNYPDLGFDLTRYSGSTAGKWGAQKPPATVQQATKLNLAHEATECQTFEALRDFLHNGHGVSTCGGEGYSDSRDENGVSKRKGSWAHAMACGGADDRHIVHQLYGEGLVLIGNSWGKWNRGPRDIVQSAGLVPAHLKDDWIAKGIVNSQTGNLMIPDGWFWTPWSHAKNREFIAFDGVAGWAKKDTALDWSKAIA